MHLYPITNRYLPAILIHFNIKPFKDFEHIYKRPIF